MFSSVDEAIALAESQANVTAEKAGKGTVGVFFDKAVQDKKATEEAGRMVFKTRTYVEILIPGDPRNVIQEPVRDAYSNPIDDPRLRYPAAWERYKTKKGSEDPKDGTPLESWPYLNVTQVALLKHLNIHTIEALAEVGDQNLANIGPGGRDMRARAAQHIQGEGATVRELRGRLSAQGKLIKQLERELHDRFGETVE